MFKAFLLKIASAVVEDITVFGKSGVNSAVGHFVGSVENLRVGQRSVNIQLSGVQTQEMLTVLGIMESL